jgi:hypothetical protein
MNTKPRDKCPCLVAFDEEPQAKGFANLPAYEGVFTDLRRLFGEQVDRLIASLDRQTDGNTSPTSSCKAQLVGHHDPQDSISIGEA